MTAAVEIAPLDEHRVMVCVAGITYWLIRREADFFLTTPGRMMIFSLTHLEDAVRVLSTVADRMRRGEDPRGERKEVAG